MVSSFYMRLADEKLCILNIQIFRYKSEIVKEQTTENKMVRVVRSLEPEDRLTLEKLRKGSLRNSNKILGSSSKIIEEKVFEKIIVEKIRTCQF